MGMDVLAAVVACFCASLMLALLFVGLAILKQLNTHGEFRITKHIKHETIYPPQAPAERAKQDEYTKFLQEQADFANDVTRQVQSLFLDTEEGSDGK